MKISPRMLAFLYLLMGALFIYTALSSATKTDTVWNLSTIILTIIATLNLGASYRLMRLHYRIKQMKKK